MLGLIQKATQEANLCFYYVANTGDCMIVTDSGGNKRYVIGYLDDGEVFWVRCKDLEEGGCLHSEASLRALEE
jgi:hypothetical protein